MLGSFYSLHKLPTFIETISQWLNGLRHSWTLPEVMSLLAPERIPEIILRQHPAVTGGINFYQAPFAVAKAREELLSWSLIRRQHDNNTLSFYSRAIQDAIRVQLPPNVFQELYLGAWEMIKAGWPSVVRPWCTSAHDRSRTLDIWHHIIPLLDHQERFKSTLNDGHRKDYTTELKITCDVLM